MAKIFPWFSPFDLICFQFYFTGGSISRELLYHRNWWLCNGVFKLGSVGNCIRGLPLLQQVSSTFTNAELVRVIVRDNGSRLKLIDIYKMIGNVHVGIMLILLIFVDLSRINIKFFFFLQIFYFLPLQQNNTVWTLLTLLQSK